MGESKFNRPSHTSPRASHWETTATVRGFTAGGSGTVSTEAMASNRPRTQIVHDFDFIPACTRVSIITDFSAVFCEGARNSSLEGQLWNGRTAHLAARVSRFIDAKRNSRSGRIVLQKGMSKNIFLQASECGDIFRDIQPSSHGRRSLEITPSQFAQRAHSILAMVDRLKMIAA
jgi:hypothetical protein